MIKEIINRIRKKKEYEHFRELAQGLSITAGTDDLKAFAYVIQEREDGYYLCIYERIDRNGFGYQGKFITSKNINFIVNEVNRLEERKRN